MTQEQIIMNHLKEHGTITSWEAITKYHITRLSEIIRRLKKQGVNIKAEQIYEISGGQTKHYALYHYIRGNHELSEYDKEVIKNSFYGEYVAGSDPLDM